MLNPARDLEYPFALGVIDMSTINVLPKKDIRRNTRSTRMTSSALSPLTREINRTRLKGRMTSALV